MSATSDKRKAKIADKIAAFETRNLGGRQGTLELHALLTREYANALGGSLDGYDFSFELEADDQDELAKKAQGRDGAAWRALFAETAWIGRTQHGAFGYFHAGEPTLENAPVVFFEFDTGKLTALGGTLIDAFARLEDDDDDMIESLGSEHCEPLKLPAPLSPAKRKAVLKTKHDPKLRLAEHKQAKKA